MRAKNVNQKRADRKPRLVRKEGVRFQTATLLPCFSCIVAPMKKELSRAKLGKQGQIGISEQRQEETISGLHRSWHFPESEEQNVVCFSLKNYMRITVTLKEY